MLPQKLPAFFRDQRTDCLTNQDIQMLCLFGIRSRLEQTPDACDEYAQWYSIENCSTDGVKLTSERTAHLIPSPDAGDIQQEGKYHQAESQALPFRRSQTPDATNKRDQANSVDYRRFDSAIPVAAPDGGDEIQERQNH